MSDEELNRIADELRNDPEFRNMVSRKVVDGFLPWSAIGALAVLVVLAVCVLSRL